MSQGLMKIAGSWLTRLWPQKEHNRKIEQAEKALLEFPQLDCPLTHKFAPGVYLREIFMPAGTIVIGHEHKTAHFNVVLAGRARVMMDGVVEEIVAPCTFVSQPGVRKVLYILEDMRWATVHPTKETRIDKLERKLVKKSLAWVEQLKGKQVCHLQQ